MIRIGSQVDVVVPWDEGLKVRVRPGEGCARAKRCFTISRRTMRRHG